MKSVSGGRENVGKKEIAVGTLFIKTAPPALGSKQYFIYFWFLYKKGITFKVVAA